jgi:hypothetical protein
VISVVELRNLFIQHFDDKDKRRGEFDYLESVVLNDPKMKVWTEPEPNWMDSRVMEGDSEVELKSQPKNEEKKVENFGNNQMNRNMGFSGRRSQGRMRNNMGNSMRRSGGSMRSRNGNYFDNSGGSMRMNNMGNSGMMMGNSMGNLKNYLGNDMGYNNDNVMTYNPQNYGFGGMQSYGNNFSYQPYYQQKQQRSCCTLI